MDTAMTNCGKCGTLLSAQDLIESRGGIDVWRCPKCGHESGGTFSLDIPALPEGNVEVYVVWKTERATNSELAALRRAFAAYRDIPIGELRRVATGGELYLGPFEYGAALDMQRAGAAEGLVVVTR
jgi:ribosomal protein L37AE/L43A